MDKTQPFQTNNRHLAYALMCAGIPFDCEAGPAANIYSLGFLQQPKFERLLKGMDIDAAAALLLRRKIVGDVSWIFERTPEFFEFMKAWDGMIAAVQKAERTATEPEIPVISAATVAVVLFVALHKKTSERFDAVAWKNRGNCMVSTMQGTRKKVGEGDQRHEEITAKGKAWTIGSRGVRDHLKV